MPELGLKAWKPLADVYPQVFFFKISLHADHETAPVIKILIVKGFEKHFGKKGSEIKT